MTRLDVRWQVVNRDLFVIGEIHGSGGQVSFNGRATVQRSANATEFDWREWADLDLFTEYLRPVVYRSDGVEQPLGVFVVSNSPERYLSENVKQVAQPQLADLGFLLLSESPQTLGARVGESIATVLERIADAASVTERIVDRTGQFVAEPVAYPPGTKFLDALRGFANLGGYLPPHFDRFGRLRLRAAPTQSSEVEAAYTSADILRDTRVENTDVLASPNTFVVIGGGATATNVLAVSEIAPDAPGSVRQRAGRRIYKVIKEQGIDTRAQAQAVARAAAETADNQFREVVLQTVPNGDHCCYSVVTVNGEKYLEVGWQLPLDGTGPMTHTLVSSLEFVE